MRGQVKNMNLADSRIREEESHGKMCITCDPHQLLLCSTDQFTFMIASKHICKRDYVHRWKRSLVDFRIWGGGGGWLYAFNLWSLCMLFILIPAQWIVHVRDECVIGLQNVANDGKWVRIKDGILDCNVRNCFAAYKHQSHRSIHVSIQYMYNR